MNSDTIQGKWTEIKGELQKVWGKITDNEWEQTKGDAKKISGLIQQKYGEQKDEVGRKVNDVFNRYSNRSDDDSILPQ